MTEPQNPGGYPPQQPGPQPQPAPGQAQPQPQPGYPPAGPQGYPGAAGGPPPGYGVPPQQPPKKKRTGLIIGLAVGIPLVLIALVVVTVLLFVGAATGPAGATNDFLKALKNNDSAALESASCAQLVSSGELDTLQSQLNALAPSRGTISSYDINSSSFENNSGSASGTVTYTKGVTKDVDAVLAKEGGKWKVCGIHEN